MPSPDPLPDPRNESIWVHVGGELVPRAQAKVSVFDSSVQGGDAVWEGLRVYRGRVFALDRHLDRLLASARALAFAQVPARDAIKAALFECLAKNGMRDGVHVRLTLTRGLKATSGMDPRNNRFGSCLIVLPEWKPPADTQGRANDGSRGLRLVTAATRRNPPSCLDSKIHHANLLNNILAKIEANAAGVDDALMLDLDGFLAETNSANVFLVKRGAVLTPFAEACLPGITRAIVLELCRSNSIDCVERRLSLTDAWTADEFFTTGTLGELAPVFELDGRRIGSGARGPLTERLQRLYSEKTSSEGEPLPG
jgi:branched-chain amino acid aminotransferase group I